MIVRCRLQRIFGLLCVLLAFSGCSDQFLAGPLQYVDNDALTKDIKDKPNLADKPKLQERVRAALAKLYGPNPRNIIVPEGLGPLLTDGGARLANYRQVGESIERNLTPDQGPIVGGYAIYRRNCLHCHGVSGAGDGPTALFLYPPPRDYRKGLFKFTSTPNSYPPHRDDLRRTIRNGLHGTSMPAFEALLSAEEIEEVIDYVIFLSVRGQTELALIEEGVIADETDINALSMDVAHEVSEGIFNKWKSAQSPEMVMNPPIPRTSPSRESILRGRNLFLGRTKEKLECAGCHGMLARGDGPSFVPQDVFNKVVFGGDPSERQTRIDQLDEKMKDLWKQKLDEWGNPLRPNNLNRGVYKGGRRPLDLYWRIAKGITGAQMPAHYPTIDEKKIWDLVNFVLALPYEPSLLKDAATTAVAEAPAMAVR
ncbi:MAG: c-type cytochrome [Planctomycetaceae bacterium]|nr:c-type cytochrome [Planctomycetaceae bacterium]